MKKIFQSLLIAVGALLLTIGVAGGASASSENQDYAHKSYVCKYVGTPGVDERLQTGHNPIWVDNHSLTGKDDDSPKSDPEPGIDQCPGYVPPTTEPPVTTVPETTVPVTTVVVTTTPDTICPPSANTAGCGDPLVTDTPTVTPTDLPHTGSGAILWMVGGGFLMVLVGLAMYLFPKRHATSI